MAFSFAVQPQDYALRAQAGLSLDPSMGDPALTAQAQQVAAAPPAQMQPQGQPQVSAPLPDIKVSPAEAIMSWLAHGGTPAEAAQQARATKVQNMMAGIQLQQAQERFRLANNLSDRDRLDYLSNSEKFAESDAKNLEPQKAGADDTLIFRGGPANWGGSQYSGPGTTSATGGLIVNTRRGVIGNYATPQTVAPGASLKGFEPGYSAGAGGPGAPASAPGWAINGIPSAPGAPATAPATPIGPPGKFDAANFIKSFILPHEGGLNPHDMNGAPSKFGINAKANPGVDVPNLTADQASAIYQNKYLPMSGAADLPPALAAVHLDTSIINPTRAHQFLEQSGGDPAKYLQLRQAWMDHMVQTNPAAAPYARAWNQRNADLGKLIAGNAGGASPQASPQGGAQTVVSDLAQGRQPRTLTPQEAQAAGFAPGAVVQLDAEGKLSVAQEPEYGAAWDRGQRDSFAGNEAVKKYTTVVQPTYKALVGNVGKMTGPAAYAILDATIQNDNPNMGTRQAQLDAFEHKFGIGAEFMGKLLNFQGKGSIPKDMQQKILDAVAPYAQAHYDAARSLYDANTALAREHHRNPNDVTIPVGDRPERYVVGANGAVPESQVLNDARAAIKAGRDPQMIRQRLNAMHINASGL